MDAGTDARLDERTADLAYGQIVVIAARWILLVGGFILALWDPGNADELRAQITLLLVLAIANFYLQAQLLRRKPVIEFVAYAASAADLAIVSLLVANQGGYASSLYIFYYPAILAYSVSFHTILTVLYTLVAVGVYALICIGSLGVMIGAEGEPQYIAARIATIVAVAFCGNVYWRLEGRRRDAVRAAQGALQRQVELGAGAAPAATSPASVAITLETLRTPEHEAAEDLFFGQLVTIWARWFLVGASILLILWFSDAEVGAGVLAERIRIALVLTAMNFFLHGRYLLDRPANRQLVLLTSALDAFVITATVAFSSASRGLESQYFVFYYPVLLGFAFVFPPRTALAFTAVTCLVYAAVCAVVDSVAIATSIYNQKLLLNRAITMAATGGLATYYWRIQRDRRRAALGLSSAALGAVRAVRLGLARGLAG